MVARLVVAGVLPAVVLACIASPVAAQRPARIVSTSPSITEVLFALGLGGRVIGVSSYCRYPAEVASLPDVGSFLRPSTELIARLRPDLVIVNRASTDVARQLTALRLRAIAVDEARSLASVYAMIREIGRAAGIADRADALVAELQARLDRVRASASGRPRRRVLIVVSRSAGGLSDLVAVGRGSYLHELVGVAGGVNVLDDPGLPRKRDRRIPNQRSQVFSPRGAGQNDTALARRSLASYPRISMETVIRLAPDVIVDAADMGDTVEEHVRRQRVTEALWQRQTSVAAARTGGVHAVTSDAFVVPGPRMVEAAETLARWLRDR